PSDRLLPTAIDCLSLHDALPISAHGCIPSWVHPSVRAPGVLAGNGHRPRGRGRPMSGGPGGGLHHDVPCGTKRYASPGTHDVPRSEEHTSELQSRENLVCRLLLE